MPFHRCEIEEECPICLAAEETREIFEDEIRAEIFEEERREEEEQERLITCSRCGKRDLFEVEERYSFNVYAGRLCNACCYTYRDHCGLDQPQGDSADLEEDY